MLLVDPLFQFLLVRIVRKEWHFFPKEKVKDSESDEYSGYLPTSQTDWSGLPVIFDEVFTGMFRLGRLTSAHFIKADPDISVHAKLLTGLADASILRIELHVADNPSLL